MCDLEINQSKPAEKLWRKTLLNLTAEKEDAVDIVDGRNLVNLWDNPTR